jgi:microcystin-dependent protein
MDKVYGSGTVAVMPTFSNDAPSGYPTDGSSTGGTPATVPSAAWYNSVTCEITNAIEGGGITPDRNTLNQLNSSIAARLNALESKLNTKITQVRNMIPTVESTPSGLIAYFACSYAPNSYWLICDGRAVSRSTDSALFNKIGTTYGAGNGSTTFNLPYLLDRVAWGSTSSIGAFINAGLPNITGCIGDFNTYDNDTSLASGAFWRTYTRTNQGSRSGSNDEHYRVDMNASRCSAVYGRSSTVQPPALRLLPCIHI